MARKKARSRKSPTRPKESRQGLTVAGDAPPANPIKLPLQSPIPGMMELPSRFATADDIVMSESYILRSPERHFAELARLLADFLSEGSGPFDPSNPAVARYFNDVESASQNILKRKANCHYCRPVTFQQVWIEDRAASFFILEANGINRSFTHLLEGAADWWRIRREVAETLRDAATKAEEDAADAERAAEAERPATLSTKAKSAGNDAIEALAPLDQRRLEVKNGVVMFDGIPHPLVGKTPAVIERIAQYLKDLIEADGEPVARPAGLKSHHLAKPEILLEIVESQSGGGTRLAKKYRRNVSS